MLCISNAHYTLTNTLAVRIQVVQLGSHGDLVLYLHGFLNIFDSSLDHTLWFGPTKWTLCINAVYSAKQRRRGHLSYTPEKGATKWQTKYSVHNRIQNILFYDYWSFFKNKRNASSIPKYWSVYFFFTDIHVWHSCDFNFPKQKLMVALKVNFLEYRDPGLTGSPPHFNQYYFIYIPTVI